jgi:hypothetical protein
MCGVYPNSNGACAACIRIGRQHEHHATGRSTIGSDAVHAAPFPLSVMIGDGVVCGKGKLHFSHS